MLLTDEPVVTECLSCQRAQPVLCIMRLCVCYVIWTLTKLLVVLNKGPDAVLSPSIPALARRASDHSNSGKQPAETDPNKRKNIRKAKGGIKVPYCTIRDSCMGAHAIHRL